MAKVVTAYYRWSADRIIGEVNNGGDYIEQVLRTVDEHAAYGQVRASRGKRVRVEPIAALFEQGRRHIVGAMVELEDELCSWVPDAPSSPDRLDAMVWSITELAEGTSALAYLNALRSERATPTSPASATSGRELTRVPGPAVRLWFHQQTRRGRARPRGRMCQSGSMA